MHNQMVAVQGQLLCPEQLAATQQQAHIAWSQIGGVVNPAHGMAPCPEGLDQPGEIVV